MIEQIFDTVNAVVRQLPAKRGAYAAKRGNGMVSENTQWSQPALMSVVRKLLRVMVRSPAACDHASVTTVTVFDEG